jgi:ATP-dependent protease Clp ATPase subunit
MIRLKQLRCSFCRKRESQVEKLVAGPRAYTGGRVFICDACVAIATRIMNESESESNPPAVQRSLWRKVLDRITQFAGRSQQRLRLSVAAH